MKIKYYYCIIIILVSLLIACGNAEKKPTLTVPMDAKAGGVFLEADIYKVDDIELKAMIRSNPGLMLLHNGVVLGKWHFNDFPDKKELEEVIASAETE